MYTEVFFALFQNSFFPLNACVKYNLDMMQCQKKTYLPYCVYCTIERVWGYLCLLEERVLKGAHCSGCHIYASTVRNKKELFLHKS